MTDYCIIRMAAINGFLRRHWVTSRLPRNDPGT